MGDTVAEKLMTQQRVVMLLLVGVGIGELVLGLEARDSIRTPKRAGEWGLSLTFGVL